MQRLQICFHFNLLSKQEAPADSRRCCSIFIIIHKGGFRGSGWIALWTFEMQWLFFCLASAHSQCWCSHISCDLISVTDLKHLQYLIKRLYNLQPFLFRNFFFNLSWWIIQKLTVTAFTLEEYEAAFSSFRVGAEQLLSVKSNFDLSTWSFRYRLFFLVFV